MPEPLSNTQLKNRLLGAAILVVVAVVVIPMFLGEPKHQVEEVDAPQSTEFESRIQPLPGTDVGTETPSEAQQEQVNSSGGLVLKKLDDQATENRTVQEQEAPSAVKIKPLDLAPGSAGASKDKPAPSVTPTPTPKPQPKPQASVTEIQSGWVVQVGVYSKSANATGVAADLKTIGYAPKVSDVSGKPGQKRVWIGPYKNKSEAENVSKQLAAKRGDGGYVKAYPF